jgi:outer membrane biosynthesis protein TonB
LSSILRALRKLDEDARDGRTEELQEQKVKMRRVIHLRAGSSQTLNWMIVIIAALVLAVSLWVVLNTLKQEIPEKEKKPALAHVQQPEPQPKPAQTQVQQVQREQPKPQPRPAPPVHTPAPEKEIKPETTKFTQVKPPVPSPTSSTSPSKPQSKRPELTLNGILWSETPARRVALIDDKYLKEGDTVKGVTIVRIEKKTVTLKLGEDQWTIRVKK